MVKPKRRDPRRRPLNPRVIPSEREVYDPREERADITYKPTETYGPDYRVTFEQRDKP